MVFFSNILGNKSNFLRLSIQGFFLSESMTYLPVFVVVDNHGQNKGCHGSVLCLCNPQTKNDYSVPSQNQRINKYSIHVYQ